MKKILSLAMFVLAAYTTQAQTQTYSNTDPKTGVKITTKITPLPSENAQAETLETQIANLELLHRNASQNPDLVANGTVAKYAQALADKRTELAAQRNTPNSKNKLETEKGQK